MGRTLVLTVAGYPWDISNTLCIEFAQVELTTAQRTCKLPLTLLSTNYKVVFGDLSANLQGLNYAGVISRTTASFNALMQAGTGNMTYIVVGY